MSQEGFVHLQHRPDMHLQHPACPGSQVPQKCSPHIAKASSSTSLSFTNEEGGGRGESRQTNHVHGWQAFGEDTKKYSFVWTQRSYFERGNIAIYVDFDRTSSIGHRNMKFIVTCKHIAPLQSGNSVQCPCQNVASCSMLPRDKSHKVSCCLLLWLHRLLAQFSVKERKSNWRNTIKAFLIYLTTFGLRNCQNQHNGVARHLPGLPL